METIATRKTKAGALAYIRSQGREPGAWVPEDYWNGRETLAVETVWDVEPYDGGTYAVVSEMRLVDLDEPAPADDTMKNVHRLITAQDNATPRVLVTYSAPDGRKTTERVSAHLADLLRSNGLLVESKEITHDPEGRCEWFGLCPNPAAGHVVHPVLGNVPTCQLCADRFELPLVK